MAKFPLSDVAVALIVTIVFIIANVFGVRINGPAAKRLYVLFLGRCCYLVPDNDPRILNCRIL